MPPRSWVMLNNVWVDAMVQRAMLIEISTPTSTWVTFWKFMVWFLELRWHFPEIVLKSIIYSICSILTTQRQFNRESRWSILLQYANHLSYLCNLIIVYKKMFIKTSLLLSKQWLHTGLGKCLTSDTLHVKESNVESTRTYSGHSQTCFSK